MQKGHSLHDIGNFTLAQFLMIQEGSMQIEAMERMGFVTDIGSVVGSMFGGETPSPVQRHIDLLEDAAAGVKRDGRQQN